ncbi:MAG: DUF3445 domain-containing protein [Acidimicrobiales bacterium]
MSTFPYVPLDERPWRLSMGLRPLDHSRWLEVDARRDEELALKRRLVSEQRDVVVALRDEGNTACEELRDLVIDNLSTNHPGVSRDVVTNEHPLVQASLMVQEDLCVLVLDGEWRLAAACVCFPSRWSLASKIGTTLDAIHEPVPGYHEELSRPTNAFFARLKPDRSFWRLNWTLLNDASLFQPESHRANAVGVPDEWSFRVERQTLRLLPTSRAAVFTIRTYVASVQQLKNEHADFAEHLLGAIDSAPPALKAYKGWVGVAERLRESLSRT